MICKADRRREARSLPPREKRVPRPSPFGRRHFAINSCDLYRQRTLAMLIPYLLINRACRLAGSVLSHEHCLTFNRGVRVNSFPSSLRASSARRTPTCLMYARGLAHPRARRSYKGHAERNPMRRAGETRPIIKVAPLFDLDR